jgi:hypothetical protein
VHRGGGIALASSWMECGGCISECTARSDRPFEPHGTRNLVSVVNRFDFLHRVVVSAISSPMAIKDSEHSAIVSSNIRCPSLSGQKLHRITMYRTRKIKICPLGAVLFLYPTQPCDIRRLDTPLAIEPV